jgi:hypothetical protein
MDETYHAFSKFTDWEKEKIKKWERVGKKRKKENQFSALQTRS